MVEVTALDGVLVWDGRVLELFSDGSSESWRVLGTMVTEVRLDVRKDRLHLELDLSNRFRRSVQVALTAEPTVRAIVAELAPAV